MKKYHSKKTIFILTIIIITILGFFKILNIKAVTSNSYKPLEPSYFNVEANKDQGSDDYLIRIEWIPAPNYGTIDKNGKTINLSDYGFVVGIQELKSEFVSDDQPVEIVAEEYPGSSIDKLTTNGLTWSLKKSIGDLERKFKIKLMVWDKSIGNSDDVNNHITVSEKEIEINPIEQVCTK